MSYTREHLSAALEWIERERPDGIALVARALSETAPPSPGEETRPSEHSTLDDLRWLSENFGSAPLGELAARMRAAIARAREEGRGEAFEEAARKVEEIRSVLGGGVDASYFARQIRALASRDAGKEG